MAAVSAPPAAEPLPGTGLMLYLVDATSGWTSAWLFVAGGVLPTPAFFFSQSTMGTVRAKLVRWLP